MQCWAQVRCADSETDAEIDTETDQASFEQRRATSNLSLLKLIISNTA